MVSRPTSVKTSLWMWMAAAALVLASIPAPVLFAQGPTAFPGAPTQPGGPGLGGPSTTEAASGVASGMRIQAIDNINAIFVQYDNAAQLQEVKTWIERLDVPTPQVSLEVKFVEVVEDKAHELSSEFSISDLTNLDIGKNDLASGSFGTDSSEFTSPFEPATEGLRGANLPKGASVLKWITGSSPISIELRALEASGLINIVNGPHIIVQNGQSSSFEIERRFGIPVPVAGSTGGTNDQFTAVPSLTAVQLDLTVNSITKLGFIELEIDGEVQDVDQNVGAISLLQPNAAVPIVAGQPGARQGVYNANFDVGVLRKVITTQVRIKDGGTVVLGGWTSQRDQDLNSGVPILSDIPYVGKLFFSRNKTTSNKITLLIFLTGKLID